ncbi:MAG TPA: aspartyl protease family protein [Candidatus Cybelea sp.]|jgi:hypothetical protein|nr:aspartyl protease family protein [Candidatus Cybelea sp.]
MKSTNLYAAAFAAALISLAPAASQAQVDPQAAGLIAASGKAQNVAHVLSSDNMKYEATITAVGLKGTATQWVDLRTGVFAESSTLGPLTQADGYDGNVTWNADRSGLVWNDGSDSGRASEIDQAYVASYGLWRPNAAGARVEWLGVKSAGNVSYDALRITPAGAKVPFEMWFDRATHLPKILHYTNNFNTATVTIESYANASGTKVPATIKTESSDGNNSESRMTGVEWNVPGADAALARPQTKPNDFSMLGGKTSTTIPSALHENHVYLDVMLNGKGPYHFIFDTGGSNLVDPAVAKEIGAFGTGNAQGNGVGSQTESLSFATVKTLQVGDAVLKDQFFAVAPTRMGFGVSAGRQVDGLIGWEVLARFVTTFDYAGNSVTLSLPGSSTPPSDGHVVPFVFYGTQPQIACTIDDIPSECTIDTGARDTLTFMTPFVTANPQVVPQRVTAVGIDGFGFGGAALGKLGRVSSVQIGDLKLNDLVADYSTQTAGALAAPFVSANLGGNLLRRFTVTFDYDNGTMTLVPNADFATADTYERSGLFLIRRGAATTVIDSRPGTPGAAAGIAKGDTIDTVNGSAASGMPLADIRALLSGPPGTVITLQLTGKDGTTRTVKITLADYV